MEPVPHAERSSPYLPTPAPPRLCGRFCLGRWKTSCTTSTWQLLPCRWAGGGIPRGPQGGGFSNPPASILIPFPHLHRPLLALPLPADGQPQTTVPPRNHAPQRRPVASPRNVGNPKTSAAQNPRQTPMNRPSHACQGGGTFTCHSSQGPLDRGTSFLVQETTRHADTPIQHGYLPPSLSRPSQPPPVSTFSTAVVPSHVPEVRTA